MSETVVFVHGLWLTGHESALLKRRLARDFGFDVRTFRYPTVSASMAEIGQRLERFVHELPAAPLHWVGHSLGGLVIHRFLERRPEQLAERAPGRVVFLGTPALASRAARSAGRVRLLAALMGRCVAEELLVARPRCWASAEPLGIIAGSRSMGFGRLFARFAEDNDGTIAVSETRLPGAREHLTLPVSHMGMLLSATVARATGNFLREGHFGRVRGAHVARSSSCRSR
ncbi:MAG TPA: alpha/beta fold hydrolase [Steroidobacteraceae bacterium]|nr:alpha/beta fold hydrolase [Steroidobacteraceae bacterium]